MRWRETLGCGLALWLGDAAFAQAPATTFSQSPVIVFADEPPATPEQLKNLPAAKPMMEPASAATACPTCNLCGDDKPWGPTLPENVNLLNDLLGLGNSCGCGQPIKVYGWLDAGYTYSSTGHGLLNVETRENRFGDEVLLNQAAIVIEKPLDQKQFSWGFNVTYYAGADASLLQPKGGIDDPPSSKRFSEDFRQLYVSAHLPILTEGGVDVAVGRHGHIIGYESAMAPYRPFYSNDYQWFYAEEGAWTGVMTTVHVNKQLDFVAVVHEGANTFFTMRDHHPSYIAQLNYWLTEEKKTLFSTAFEYGDNAIFSAPGCQSKYDYIMEVRLQHEWNKYLTQIIQTNNCWGTSIPGIGTGEFYSLYTILINHVTPCVDLNFRTEWVDDVQGTRTGFATPYEEVTVGFDYHPVKELRIRPELRGDFAEEKVFGNGTRLNKSMLTAAVDVLFSF